MIKEYSEKRPMARHIRVSFTRFRGLVGGWDRVAEGVYPQLVVA